MKSHYLKSLFSGIILLVFGLSSVKAQVYINEIVQSNLNIIMDDLNDYPDSWIELYNAGSETVNLEGYGLNTKSKFSSSYKLPYYLLEPYHYVVIYCDKVGSGLHTDFRVESGSKGNLYLYDPSGTEIDAVTNMSAMPSPDVAYARIADGDPEWSYMVTPTPGESNNSSMASNIILPEPEFNLTGGLYTSAISVYITKPESAPANAVVRYTIDGSEPDRNSSRVLNEGESLNINSTTVVKAKLFAFDAVSPMATTHSYIFHGREVTLPVISVSTDSRNFYDSKIGIYVEGTYNYGNFNYTYNWRRPINFEYIDGNEGVVLNQLGETRVSGGGSREAPMKSLIVYGNKRFGEKHYDYPFFNDKPEIPIKSFLMRNSGNDFLWSHIRDASIQLICQRGGMDLDWQAYQPAIWYLNGSYMGIINLRERSNEDHIYSNYNKLEDIDMLENWIELKAGDEVNYTAFKEFYARTNNTYEEWEEWMDVSEFMNMFILNTYQVNLDFPGNNIVMWRPRTDEGKWRWIIKDTDFGLGLYGREHTYNYLNFILRTGNYEENWANGWDETRLFRRLIDNERFRNEFIDRFAVSMGDFLNADFGGAIIDSLKSNIAYEFPHFKSRYHDYNAWLDWNTEVNNMKTWMRNRTTYMYSHLRSYFALNTIVPVKINTEMVDAQNLNVSFNENMLSRGVFDGRFFIGREIRLNATSKLDDKEVVGWKLTKTISGNQTTDVIEGNTISYTMPTGCSRLTFEAIVDNTTGIIAGQVNDILITTEKDGIIISNISEGATVVIYNAKGQAVSSETSTSDLLRFDLPQKGVYLISIIKDGISSTHKIIF